MNNKRWIVVVLNLMEDEARMWALPHLESLATRGMAFSNIYHFFVEAFTKRFAPLNTTDVKARWALYCQMPLVRCPLIT